MKKLTVKELLSLKGKRKITMTTALDYYTAKAAEKANIDIIGAGAGLVEYLLKGETLFKEDTLEEVAYAIQETADRFVRRVEGSFSNVVGLPVELLGRMLERARRPEAAKPS